jgi:S1-C subfamily serine protease
MRTGRIIFFVSALIITVLSATQFRYPTPTSAEVWSNSVVLVYNESGHGSGAIVGQNEVLTAKHVALQGNLRVQTADGNDYAVVGMRLDPDSDLAILEIDGVFDEAPFVIDKTPLKVGEEVAIIGTPYDRALLNCVLHGRIVKVKVEVPTNDIVDMSDAHAGGGCSGGPMVDTKGKLRGVCVLSVGLLNGSVPVGELDAEIYDAVPQ